MNAALTAGLAVALLLAGGALGSPSLQLPGVALALLAGSAVAWVRLASRGARVERRPGPPTITEGEPYPLRIDLRWGLIRPRGELLDPLLGRPIPIPGPGGGSPAGRGQRVLRAEARLARRGRHRLGPPRVVIRDPLGLCSRLVEGTGEDRVLVLPRVEPVQIAGAANGGQAQGPAAGRGDGGGGGLTEASDIEVDGLRPYRKGSPGSRIHWPAVARHGELIERRLVSGADHGAIVALDAARPAGPEALDAAVRAVASLCVHLARAGGCTLLVPGAPRPLRIDRALRGWPAAHARLALVEPGDALSGIARLAPAGITFWVTADRAGGLIPRPGRSRSVCLVTPFAPQGPAAFTVAGCHGRPVPTGRRARSAA